MSGAYVFNGSFTYGVRVVRVSSTVIYVIGVVSNSSLFYIYKSTNNGGSFSQISSVSTTDAHGNSTFFRSFDMALDSQGYLHVVTEVQLSSPTRGVAYNKYNTANDSWGTWEQAAPYALDASFNSARIFIDANDKPHIVYGAGVAYKKVNYAYLYYVEKTGSSWTSPVQISSTVDADHYNIEPWIESNGDIHVSFYKSGTVADGFWRDKISGTWGSELNSGSYTYQYSARVPSVEGKLSSNIYSFSINSSYYLRRWYNRTSITDSTITASYATVLQYGTDIGIIYKPSNNIPALIIFDGSNYSTPLAVDDTAALYLQADASYLHQVYDGGVPFLNIHSNGDCYCVVIATDVTYEPAAIDFGLTGTDPTVSITTTPNRAYVSFAQLVAGISGAGGVTVTPSAISFGFDTVDPSVTIETFVTPSPVTFGLSATFPLPRVKVSYARFVKELGLTVQGGIASFGLSGADPTVTIVGPVTLDLSGSPIAFALISIDPFVSIPVTVDLSGSPLTFALLTLDPTVIIGNPYIGVLKYWDGAVWQRALLKTWNGATWENKPLKCYIDSEFQEIDVTG